MKLKDFNDTEIWRTSTAEPTTKGIIWTYKKDVSNYHSMWKQPQKIIFDLGNLIDSKYTGLFNTTLHATFFSGKVRDEPADIIVPISKKRGAENKVSAFRLPEDGRAVVAWTPPRNGKKAIFTISACGQAEEEFWWSNVPQSYVRTFGNDTLSGFSPWRELQLLIDGNLAGVAWPFPVIFTGGIVPSLWRPLVGIDTYDLREDEIDITPWLPVISDGKEHVFEMRVMGLNDDGNGRVSLSPVGHNWVVTGKIFFWSDVKADGITAGQAPKVFAPDPTFGLQQTVMKSANGANASLSFKISASREFSVEGSVTTSEGSKPAGWKQTLNFSNAGDVARSGNVQINEQVTTGLDISTSGYSRKFSYPLKCNSSLIQQANKDLTLTGKVERGKSVAVLGSSVWPSGLESYGPRVGPDIKGFSMNTTQAGEASFQMIGNLTRGNGMTEQFFVYKSEKGGGSKYPDGPKLGGESELLYSRHALAMNGKITRDDSLVDTTGVGLVRTVSEQAVMMVPADPQDIERAVGRKYASRVDRVRLRQFTPASQVLFAGDKRGKLLPLRYYGLLDPAMTSVFSRRRNE
jgi:hypothetical protein